MQKLTPDDLMTLERYARERPAFRARVLAHKKLRTIQLGAHMTLIFEDRLTVQYQVQEMLRIERLFEPDAIADELGAYNPLIPDGTNLKATLLIAYPDADERARELERLRAIENAIFLQIAALPRVVAIADEDLDRSNDKKTSAVHFLRFELEVPHQAALRAGEPVQFGVDDPRYPHSLTLAANQTAALATDLD